jgi:hypothetical protein
MKILVQAGIEQIATYELLLTHLEEAVLRTNISTHTPIALDRFLIRNSAFPTHVIPTVPPGNVLKLFLYFDPNDPNDTKEKEKYDPKLLYCTGKNLTKSTIQTYWNDYFITKETNRLDTDLRIYPNDENKCSIEVKPAIEHLQELYISYSATISLKMNTGEGVKKLDFIMDPLVKVSSNQG